LIFIAYIFKNNKMASYRERGITGLNDFHAAPYASNLSPKFSWDDAQIGWTEHSSNETEEKFESMNYLKILVCPLLDKKVRELGVLHPQGRIHHLRTSVWKDGEFLNGRGIPNVGKGQMYRQREDVWEIPYGSPVLKKEDVTREMFGDAPLTMQMKMKVHKKVNDSRPVEIVNIVTEYGSTRVNESRDGWDRYIVMYEKGMTSPHPFEDDCTQNFI